MSGRILVVGSANVDYVAFVENAPRPGETVTGTRFATHPGGKGANQAFAAARLGAASALIARVGRDTQGAWLAAHLASGGVETRDVVVDDEATTGVALIVVDHSGENSIVVAPGANGRLTPADVTARADRFATAQAVLLQLEAPLDTVTMAAEEAQRAGCTVLLDPAPARSLPDGLLGLADYVTPNETELLTLCGRDGAAGAGAALTLADAETLARTLLERGPSRVMAKLGAAGALLVGRELVVHAPAPAVRAVDTTAAGDVFNAAFAAALTDGADEQQALRYGVAAAAVSVTREGAQSSMPTAAEVRALLAGAEPL